jgi:hypothetical protein
MERYDGPVRGNTASLNAIQSAFSASGVDFISETGTIGVVQKIDTLTGETA